ncbi:hypothetical protein TRFO_10110 [Tritrichomonas foetus]|uniref:Nucleoplasmin-like domain-containing protein n=1 Tax=Tritrichomonas foetus TaxID=1144522 RepID=A0A1J4JC00_9EUKA|nr:hypothetical protein TRFO_10110 [Tritrichomonas foetus]|eukprot:OHS96185.1 hypothetical protein TRFO_10110 [Tritrichomonas foetus]
MESLSSFTSVVVNPEETVKVSTNNDAIWSITSVSIKVTDDLPKEGRVVLYISQVGIDGTVGNKIAIAPLRVRDCEVVNADYSISSPVVFSTTGAKISVSVTGYTTSLDSLIIERTSTSK